MNIGQRIKKVRENRGKTLQQVADVLGVTEATAQRYESGNIKNLKLDTISKIAEFLGADPAYLMGWLEDNDISTLASEYSYFPTSISAGVPFVAEPVAEYNVEKLSVPDSMMGKWAGDKDIFITRVNGDSMNNIMPDQSLIAVKPVEPSTLKDGDIVVFSDDGDYSVKRYYRDDHRIIFRPDSKDKRFYDYITDIGNEKLVIHGKVVLYIVELD